MTAKTTPAPTPTQIDYSDQRGGVYVVRDGKRVRLEPEKPAQVATPTENTNAA